MLLNFPYHGNWYQQAQNSSNCLHIYTLPLVANRSSLRLTLYKIIWHCLSRCWKDPGDRSEMDLRNLRRYVHCERICESSTNEAQTSLLLCLCVYFLRGSTGHCIQGLSFRPYWWDLILTTSEIALSHFTRMTQIALLSFCCVSGSCRVRAAEAWIVTLANCLWPDTTPTLPVTLWEVLFQTCRTHDHAVLCCPSWNLYKFDINLWGRGTSSWAVSI